MRQTGPENARFVELLSRLREGRQSVNKNCWDTPIIVTDNATKDAMMGNDFAIPTF